MNIVYLHTHHLGRHIQRFWTLCPVGGGLGRGIRIGKLLEPIPKPTGRVYCVITLTLTDEQLDWLVEQIPDASRSPLGGRPLA